MKMEKKRTRLEVMHDILEVVRGRNGKIKPTHILYKSNLSYYMMKGYLDELISKGFLMEVALKNGRTYVITDKGLSFLAKYRLINEFTLSFGLSS